MAFHWTRKAWLGSALIGAVAVPALALPQFGDWAAPVNLELLPNSSTALNTTFVDGCASLSPDALSLAFNSNRGGNFDIYIARRSNVDEGFRDPEPLPSTINTFATEACPTLARGNRLYFHRSRPGDQGDIFVSRLGPKGWSEAQSLGPNVNSDGYEESAAFYEDDQGREVMLFSRRLQSGAGGELRQSIDGAPSTPVTGGPFNSAANNRPSVTHDGRTLYWDSTLQSIGSSDVYMATRSNTSEPWGTAQRVDELSSSGFEGRPFISWDGTILTLSSQRPGNESPAPDMWYTSRQRNTGKAPG
jgi:hypothetical protein